MAILHIDFETYSRIDLRVRGLDEYSNDCSTGVHCLGYAFGTGGVCLWSAYGNNDVQLSSVLAHVRKGGEVVAHNAAFEIAIWNNVCVPRYGWPELRVEQCRCTMAQAYAMAIPASLEMAAIAMGIRNRKDVSASLLMLKLAKPRSDGSMWTYEDSPERFERLFAYCRQDVEVERELDERMLRLSEAEQNLWVLDQRINSRGLKIDRKSIHAAIERVEGERFRLDNEMFALTGGVVRRCSDVPLLRKWIAAQGVKINGVAKADITDALSGDLPDDVRLALSLRKEAAKTSTAKLAAMDNRASRADDRVRGSMQYHGASTGRWSGRGIQPQNLPRPRPGIKQKHVEDIIAHLGDRNYVDLMYGPVLDAMADILRGMIVADEGHELIAMDFSAVEARGLAWLAGEEKVLDVFRSHGKIYEHAASGIYNVPIEEIGKEDPRRQVGKCAVLALGYGGGVGAFQSMARVYGVKVSDEQAEEIKTAWRASHPKIVRYWYDLEAAALDAVELGKQTSAGPPGREVKFKMAGPFLWCRLPSGRRICYPYPRVAERETPWGQMRRALHFMGENAVTRKWEEMSTYGGSLAENITQAVCRDLLAEAIIRLEAADYPVVFHAHDEAVVEIATSRAEGAVSEIERILSEVPSWAQGLPLSAEGWRGKRYRK